VRSHAEDVELLLELGRCLDEGVEWCGGERLSVVLAARLLKVRGRDGRPCGLVANPAQREFERRRGRENIVLKARQMGLTTWVAGRFFLKTITARGVLTVQVAQTREAAEGIFRMVERMWAGLPEAMREGVLRRSRANAGQMIFPELDSEFRVVSAGEENAGRGWTIQNLHLSEVSRWPGDAAAVLAGLRAALVPGGELVMESTPSGAYGCFYEEWMRAGEDMACAGAEAETARVGMVRHFLPWWLEESYVGPAVVAESMSEAERALVEREGLTAEQIGFRRGLERSFGGLRTQEYAEDAASCFRATGLGCFDLAAVERRMSVVRGLAESEGLGAEPLRYVARRGGALRMWLPPVDGREYVVAVDPAGGGLEGDFCAVQVVDVATGAQCAELQERLTVREAARVAAALGREYGTAAVGECGGDGEALVVVERNNHGSGVLAELRSAERYGRLWCDGMGEAGWLTTAANKPEVVARLGALLEERPELFRSERLLGECRTFVALGGGRTGAVAGAHDDLVIAMAMAMAVRAELVVRGLGRR
jgi:hypothetical protein